MAKSTLIGNRFGAISPQPIPWRIPVSQTSVPANTAVNNTIQNSRPAGTYSNLRGYMATNANNQAITLRMIIGTGSTPNSNLALSWNAGTTGAAEDTTNTDSVSDGTRLVHAWTIASGSTGNALISLMQVDFEPSSNTETHIGAMSGGVGTSTASFTCYNIIVGGPLWTNTVESDMQTLFKQNCILHKLRVTILNNTRTTTTTFRTRINGSNGNCLISIGSSATGSFEDLTGTDSIVSNDLVNTSTTTGTGTGTIQPTYIGMNVQNTTDISPFITGHNGAVARNFNTTTYFSIAGLFYNDVGLTEAQLQTKIYRSGILQNMTLNVAANTINNTSTFRARKNGTDTSLSISISNSATGKFSDVSNTEIINSTNLINYSLVTGGSSGSITPPTASIELTPLFRSISESSVSISESLTRLQAIIKSISDSSITTDETLSRLQALTKNISEDPINIDQTIEAVRLFFANLTEDQIKYYYSLLTYKT